MDVQTIHVWIKAFIGSAHPTLPDYIKKTPANSYVIAAPNIPAPKALDIGKLAGTCFTTDNRSFSDDPLSSARVTVEFLLTVTNKRTISISKWENRDITRIGVSHNINCTTGVELQPSLSAGIEGVSVGEIKSKAFLNIFNIRASSPNPFYKFAGISVAPNIDFEFIFEHNILAKRIDLKGVCGYFPWFEGYYQTEGAPVALFQIPPVGSSTANSLFDFGLGINSRNVVANIPIK